MSWTPETKKAINDKMEKHFRSHRDTPDGKNFVFWNKKPSKKEEASYRKGFDSIFPNAPGAGV